MFKSTHQWLLDHPIAQSVIISISGSLLVALLFSTWKFLVAFAKVPPQRLGVWLTKARLGAAVLSLEALTKADASPRIFVRDAAFYLIVVMISIGEMVAFTFLLILRTLVRTPAYNIVAPKPHSLYNPLFFGFMVPFIGMLYGCIKLLYYLQRIAEFEKSRRKLLHKIEQLGGKISGIESRLARDKNPVSVTPRKNLVGNPGDAQISTLHHDAKATLQINTEVTHPKYGIGIVMSSEGNGDDRKLVVNFRQFGTKKLVEKYAQLKII